MRILGVIGSVLLLLLSGACAREIVDMGGKTVEIPDVITKVFGTSTTFDVYDLYD